LNYIEVYLDFNDNYTLVFFRTKEKKLYFFN